MFREVSCDVPRIGLEPTHREAPDPKSGVSTNFTTWANRRWRFYHSILFLTIHFLKHKKSLAKKARQRHRIQFFLYSFTSIHKCAIDVDHITGRTRNPKLGIIVLVIIWVIPIKWFALPIHFPCNFLCTYAIRFYRYNGCEHKKNKAYNFIHIPH